MHHILNKQRILPITVNKIVTRKPVWNIPLGGAARDGGIILKFIFENRNWSMDWSYLAQGPKAGFYEHLCSVKGGEFLN
jgi:hypothetical protein